MSHAPNNPTLPSVEASPEQQAQSARCALAPGSLPLLSGECSNLVRAAKLLNDEAVTWSDGWAYREKDGSLRWDKDAEWAQIRWMKLRTAAENLRKIAARFVKKANIDSAT